MATPSTAAASASDSVAQRFSALHEVSRRLQGRQGDGQIAQAVLAVLEECLGYENGAILLIDRETGALQPFALSDRQQGPAFVEIDRAFVNSFAPALGRGITGWVAQHGTSVRSGNVPADPRYLAVRQDIRSELCVPIRIGDQVIGVVNVETARESAYDADDQRLLEIVATQVGYAIQLDRIHLAADLVTAQVDEIVAERTRGIQSENMALQQQVVVDHLTGIANRRGFDDALAREVRRALREQVPLSLLLIDIDHFKAYNDNYGHVAGDDCLARVAQCVAACAGRAGDYPVRFGGDEFAVILPNTDVAAARDVAARAQRRVAAEGIAHAYSPVAPVVTLSIGASTVRPVRPVDDTLAILHSADLALYKAKANGRNRIEQ